MNNIDISFGDDILISHEPGVSIDDNNNYDVSSDTLVGPQGPPGEPGFSPTARVNETDNGAIVTITDKDGTTSAFISDGKDGTSPTATVTQTASGATVSITDKNGTTSANILNGEPGEDGVSPTITIGSVTSLASDADAYVTDSGVAPNVELNFGIPRGVQGIQGPQGDPGINARAYVTQNTGSATITIEDSDGITTATVYDGQDGSDGQPGFSPTATVTPTASGATISITDQQGTTTANITNGVDGTDGTDGFSPVATVTQNTGSATISIQDANGTTTATVYDGTDGTNGTDGVTPSITASASVSNTTGTPSCSVTKSGTDANPNFAFAFTNIKGDKGDKGDSASNIPVRLWYGNISTGDVTLNDDIDNYPVLLTLWGGVGDHTIECHPIIAWSTQYTNNGASFAGWRTSSSNPDIQARVNNTNVYGYVNTQTKITIQSNNSSRNLRLILGIKK